VFITALPQSTAEVERTFSCLNYNKNKLRDCLAVCTLEAIKLNLVRIFQVTLKSTKRFMHLHGKARKTYFEKIENPEAVGAIIDETFSL